MPQEPQTPAHQEYFDIHRKQKILLLANFYAFVMPHAVVTAGEALED